MGLGMLADGQLAVIFAIKSEVSDLGAETFEFRAQKTMYGGKQIAVDDAIYIFASENEGGRSLRRGLP